MSKTEAVEIKGKCFLKIILIGEGEVGKTSLLLRMTDNLFSSNLDRTFGVDYKRLVTVLDEVEVTVQIWDTVGTDRERAVASNYYRNADGALLVYDVTRPETFKSLEFWYNELDKHSNIKPVIKILVGNKTDLAAPNCQLVILSEARAWAETKHLSNTFQTSAKNGSHVKNAFEALIRLTTKFVDAEHGITQLDNPIKPDKPNDKKGRYNCFSNNKVNFSQSSNKEMH